MYVYVFEIKIHYFGQDCILYQFNLDCQIKKVVLRKWNWNILLDFNYSHKMHMVNSHFI